MTNEEQPKKESIVSENGGKRDKLGERWDLIPGVFESLSEVAKVAEYGATKYGVDNWKTMDFKSEQSPINHAMRHAAKATAFDEKSDERIWQLSKATWNLLAQIWYEKTGQDQNKTIEPEAQEDDVFRDGDPVYCEKFGIGCILTTMGEDCMYPIQVLFHRDNVESFTKEGFFDYGHTDNRFKEYSKIIKIKTNTFRK